MVALAFLDVWSFSIFGLLLLARKQYFSLYTTYLFPTVTVHYPNDMKSTIMLDWAIG